MFDHVCGCFSSIEHFQIATSHMGNLRYRSVVTIIIPTRQ
jgi:hypothetical protein